MTTDALVAQVKALEAQLTVLKARLRAAGHMGPPSSFADLEGILSGKTDTTEERLQAAKFRGKWGWEGTKESDTRR